MPSTGRIHVQRATAAESSVVIQIGGDLYLSDASLRDLWVPREATPGECPFPGLDAFGPGQESWFFGRETLTGDLIAAFDDALRSGSGGPVLLVGPSGAGKSSLLGAGLMAALAQGRLAIPGSADWPRVLLKPGAHPLRTLHEALATCERARPAAARRTVIVVDQLEEVFTACADEAERAEFLAELATLSSADGRGLDRPAAVVVLGLRTDFYGRATGYPVLRAAMQARQFVIGAMSAAEVRQAIVLPAQQAGLTLDDLLAERLLRDLGVTEAGQDEIGGHQAASYEAGRLPLLAHVLRETWQRRDGDRLTVRAYETTGGIGGAIAKSAESVYAGLNDAERLVARRLFLALVRVGETIDPVGPSDLTDLTDRTRSADSQRRVADGEDTADTRRRVSAASLSEHSADPDVMRTVLDAFTAARLLTFGGQAVEISHEALLRRWPRLRAWIDQDRAGNLLRQGLEEAARSWDREGRDSAGLYGGVRLAAAQEWSAGPARRDALSRTAHEFLTASSRRRRRGARRRTAIIAALVALSLALTALTGFAFNQRATALSNFQTAEADELAAQSAAAYSDDAPGTAMEFALAGWRLRPASPQARSALLSTQAQPFEGRLAPAGGHELLGVAYSPSGAVLATAGYDGDVRLWSAASRRQLAVMSVGSAQAVAFSPNGATLVATERGGVRLWNVTDPARPVAEHSIRTDQDARKAGGTAVAFSPDGRTLAIADSHGSGSVQLWNLSSRTRQARLAAGGIFSLAFADSGRQLAIASDRGAVELWNPTGHGARLLHLHPADAAGGPGLDPMAVAVSPDGQTIAFGTGTLGATPSPAVKLWSLTSHRVIATLAGPGSGQVVASMAFSADGRTLAVGGSHGTVQLWDVGYPQVLLGTNTDHSTWIAGLAFNHDGSTLASASYDGSVALVDVRGNSLDGRAQHDFATAFSPDGHLLAASRFAASQFVPGTWVVDLYTMPSRTLAAVLPSHTVVSALAFSPDGRTLAVAQADATATVELWNLASHRLIGQIKTGQQGLLRGLAFSPNGRLLATAGATDPVVRIWDAARRTPVAVVDSDPARTETSDGTGAVAFSPDGRLLAVAGTDGLTLLYSVARRTLVNIDDNYGSTDASVAFSPDGHTVAIGHGDGAIYLYRVRPGGSPSRYRGPYETPRGYLNGSSRSITGVAYTPDGQTIVAAGNDGTVRLWRVTDDALIAAITTGAGPIEVMSSGGSTGMVATSDGFVTRVWQTRADPVAAGICRAARIPVTRDAWNTFLPDYPYTGVCG